MRTAALTIVLAATVVMPAGPSEASFLAPVVVSAENAHEPGIEVTADGTLYIGASAGLPGPGSVYRSRNGGTTWVKTPPGMRMALPGGSAFDLAVAPGGWLATTDLWSGSSTVARSTDGGSTWTAQPFQGEVVQDRPWVTSPVNGIVYHATHVPAGIVVAKSIDGGLTYGTRAIAPPSMEDAICICPTGNVVAESAERVGLLYSTGSGVRFMRSTDGGLTFSHHVVDPAGGHSTLESYPIAAAAGNGVVAAAWGETGSTTSRIGFSLSTDWGLTWSTPRYVVTGGASVFPWIAAQGSKIGLSLLHTTATGAPDTVSSTASWYESYVESTNLGTSWTPVQTVDVVPVKTGPICTDGLNCSSDTELGNVQSVAFDPSGRPNFAYVRSLDGSFDTEMRFVRGA